MSILELWNSKKTKGLKVRYQGWSQIKYFCIDSVDHDSRVVYGHLDNGEAASYSFSCDHFELYYYGAENNSLLV
jgi:hypothetical protein